MLADLTVDAFRRIRASYVIAADGGSCSTAPSSESVQRPDVRRTMDRHRRQVPRRVAGPRPAALPLRPRPAHRRLPHSPGPPPLGVPRPRRRGRTDLLNEEAIWEVLRGRGSASRTSRLSVSRATATTSDSPIGGGSAGFSWPATPPSDAAVDRSGHVRRRARRGQPVLEAGRRARGQVPDSVLDSYQAERLPHVKEVTNRAVKTGKLIIQRNRWRAAVRNHVLRAPRQVPGFLTWLPDHRWIPDARYGDGFLAHIGNGATGWLFPQPWVVDEKGDTVRLDDLFGGRWTSCTSAHRRSGPGGPPACHRQVAQAGTGARQHRRHRRLPDPWLAKKGARPSCTARRIHLRRSGRGSSCQHHPAGLTTASRMESPHDHHRMTENRHRVRQAHLRRGGRQPARRCDAARRRPRRLGRVQLLPEHRRAGRASGSSCPTCPATAAPPRASTVATPSATSPTRSAACSTNSTSTPHT